MRGRFITLEGSEGSGKSTNLTHVQAYLEKCGKRVRVTREPGGTPIGEQIRALLLDHRNGGMHPDTELLLMFAARAQHIHEVIRPALAAGEWVLCDRFTDASYAYQGGGRGIPAARIGVLESWVQEELQPDLTFILDVPSSVGLQRAGERGQLDRFEREKLDFFERVRGGYHARARQNPARYRIIDASLPLESVKQQVSAALADFVARS